MALTETGIEFKVKKGLLVPNNATFQDGVLYFPSLDINTLGEDNTFVVINDADANKALRTHDPVKTVQIDGDGWALISSGSNDNIINPQRINIGTYYHPFGHAQSITGSIVFNDGTSEGGATDDDGNSIITEVSSSQVNNNQTKTLFTVDTTYYHGMVVEYVVHNNTRSKTRFGTYQSVFKNSGNDEEFTHLTTTGLSTVNFALAISTGTGDFEFQATNTSGEVMYMTYEKTLFGAEVAY